MAATKKGKSKEAKDNVAAAKAATKKTGGAKAEVTGGITFAGGIAEGTIGGIGGVTDRQMQGKSKSFTIGGGGTGGDTDRQTQGKSISFTIGGDL